MLLQVPLHGDRRLKSGDNLLGGPQPLRLLRSQDHGVGTLLADRVKFLPEPLRGLGQPVPLLPQPLEPCGIFARPGDQSRKLVLGLASVSPSSLLPGPNLGHLPTSGGELRGQILAQARLLGKAIPNAPLAMEEQGFIPASPREGLRRKTQKSEKHHKKG